MNIRYIIRGTVLLVVLAGSALLNPCLGGPKLKRIVENSKKIKKLTLVIVPILPDSFALAKLEKQGPEAVKLYLDDLKSANQNLEKAFTNSFGFCKVISWVQDSTLRDYPSCFSRMRALNPDSFCVLQFGHAVQFSGERAVKIKKYDRDFLGIYKTDGITKMVINGGSVKNMWREDYAEMVAQSFRKNLDAYAKMGVKKKKRRR